VKLAAVEAGVPVHQPRGVRGPEFHERVASIAPDVLVVVAYGRILGEPLLRLAPHGAVNVHFSLLPAYRGAAPVQWALVRGETTTGVTTMLMNERLDEGDLLLQREVAIAPGEHAPALESRLAVVGAGLLVETLAGLAARTIAPRPQDSRVATLAPLLSKADGAGDPQWTAREIEGRVRGFDPWPGVWFAREGRRVRVAAARAEEGALADLPPGTLAAAAGGGLWMACGGGTKLRLLRLQPEGSREMTIADALNGRRIQAGDRLDAVAPG
jgi:methionyl-tRNA formyltransferase